MKLHLGYLLGLSALIVAACAAFFSVYGLSQLFAGASMAVIVMATALEVSKVIAASFLHRYWDEMSKVLRVYLTIGVVVLITITSAGIYGFLTNAYQKTANSLLMHEGEVALVDGKIGILKNKIENNSGLIEGKRKRVNQLTELRSVQEVRLDSMINRRYFSNANQTRDEIEKANTEIHSLQSEMDLVVEENNKLNDSINKYEIQKLEMVSTSDVAAEVGPLKYMADLTGKPMDVIVNYFILLLIFVFDPMAVSLVIATGWVFQREKKKSEEKKKIQGEYLKGQWKGGEEIWTEKKLSEDALEYDRRPHEVASEEEIQENIDDLHKDFANAVEKRIDELNPSTPEEVNKEIEKLKEGLLGVDAQDELMKQANSEMKPQPPAKPKIPLKEEDISEVKSRQRKFSVEIPKANNSVERIGSNKFLENKKTVVYRNKGNDK